MLVGFVLSAVAFRLAMLLVSLRNERRLKAHGAVEIGATNSAVLALAHVAFYLAAAAEGFALRDWSLDAVSLAGLALYLFGMTVLLLVVGSLGRLWTVKLLIAADHQLVENRLFRWVRHPNYYLNILPELIGFALVLHAWGTLLVGLPLYLVPLIVRIRQEEQAMRQRFPAY